MSRFPSSQEIIKEALRHDADIDVNSLHSKTFDVMIKYRTEYYQEKVDTFLSRLSLLGIPADIKRQLKEEMLNPVVVEGKEYSNFMEEASRRISQTFQVVSGSLAELCAQRELERVGLQKDIHFTVRKERTDLTVYCPNIASNVKHRIEVKNVKLRERATRGLGFDGDSMFGFFNDPNEFSGGNVEVIDEFCRNRGGYCYIPPSTLERIEYKGARFKPNTQFGKDMLSFVRIGRIP